ncbi:MAG: polysaccharide deacetylase family protein [Deltaproteobacteria bacterium]|nr:polysaccharide deacetylase family protein [Deltaproteobacteria bacterium]
MADLALKIDIDTFRGMKEGVPRLVAILAERSIAASFFVSFGPDRSGLALLQLVRPRFLRKMIRTNAPGLYGLKTALYGTLLPAPMIGIAFPDTLREIRALGHEIACHAWDHRVWQDWLSLMSNGSIHRWFEKMVDAYADMFGERPSAFGAPGWRMNDRALAVIKKYGFCYQSCTRAHAPFISKENGLLEIPSNLPCIEEAGVEGVMQRLKENAHSTGPQVLPVHAEVEGGPYLKHFKDILDLIRTLGYSVKRLADIADDIDTSQLECRQLKQGIIPGRAFACAL